MYYEHLWIISVRYVGLCIDDDDELMNDGLCVCVCARLCEITWDYSIYMRKTQVNSWMYCYWEFTADFIQLHFFYVLMCTFLSVGINLDKARFDVGFKKVQYLFFYHHFIITSMLYISIIRTNDSFLRLFFV